MQKQQMSVFGKGEKREFQKKKQVCILLHNTIFYSFFNIICTGCKIYRIIKLAQGLRCLFDDRIFYN